MPDVAAASVFMPGTSYQGRLSLYFSREGVMSGTVDLTGGQKLRWKRNGLL